MARFLPLALVLCGLPVLTAAAPAERPFWWPSWCDEDGVCEPAPWEDRAAETDGWADGWADSELGGLAPADPGPWTPVDPGGWDGDFPDGLAEAMPEPPSVEMPRSEGGSLIMDWQDDIRATRLFAGPSQYPPQDFAAYGIVAFPGRAATFDRDRHVMICEAYVASLPDAASVSTPTAEQMVTIWPMRDNDEALRLVEEQPATLCEDAVRGYNLTISQRALRAAARNDASIGTGRGPYLLAWSPGGLLGQTGAQVLGVDMSRIESYEQASAVFRGWTRDIESNPDLWRRGWNIEAVRLALRRWSDDMGRMLWPS